MATIETIFLACVYIFIFALFFMAGAGLLWLFEKIGLSRWLRGWAWFLGLSDTCPESEKRDR